MSDPSVFEIEARLILEGLYLKYGEDFRGYSSGSIRRRLASALSHFKVKSLSELQGVVLHDPAAAQEFFQLLTVPTSEMFRDPAYFRVLRERVFPILATYPSIKIWVAGCSTGEEVYSLAILLKEEGLLDRSVLYATDINSMSLQKAKAGVFPLHLMATYTANYQRSGGKCAFADYYRTNESVAVFDPALRSKTVFASHNLATDSVFAEVQFVSCRNVLIYFDRPLQDRVFDLFRDTLDRRGFLGLGSRETLRFYHRFELFEEFAPDEKIYRLKGAVA